jgi:CDP-glycerol glycerophosphotransferase
MYKKLKTLFTLIIGWFFIVPLAYFIPKKRDKILFIGRDNGLFLDNVKHLYLYMEKKYSDYDISFLTEDIKTFTLLSEHRRIFFPSLTAFWNLLRTNILVIDNGMWIRNFKIYFLWKAKKVQLWHGIGLKKIHLNDPDWIKLYKKFSYRIYFKLLGLPVRYQLLLSTNNYFYQYFFKKSFRSEDIICCNYPRNATINNPNYSKNYDIFLNSDFDFKNKICSRNNTKFRILYLPTFRDSGSDVFSENILDLEILNNFALKNNFLFIFKFHPDPRFKKYSNQFDNILWFDSSKDIYPLIDCFDLLITDYSSFYFDFLLTEKPIIFFAYDLEKYQYSERPFVFDYKKMTPGPIVKSQNELQLEILNIHKMDIWKNERINLKNKSFNTNLKGNEFVAEAINKRWIDV